MIYDIIIMISVLMFLFVYRKFENTRTRTYIVLKDKSGVDKIIVKKELYQPLYTNRDFIPSFDASNFHKSNDQSS